MQIRRVACRRPGEVQLDDTPDLRKPHLIVRSVEDADRLINLVRDSAARVHDWIAAQRGEPLELPRKIQAASPCAGLDSEAVIWF